MITLTKSGNAIVFTFDDNDHYLNDGKIEVPVNSLTLVTDESQMATFRKSASNDIFISATYDELGMSKADLESWFKENAFDTGGVTEEWVEEYVSESISGKADTSDVQEIASDVSTVSGDVNTLSGSVNALTGDVNTLSGYVSTLSGSVDSNHNAITALNGDVQTLSGQVQGDETILTGHTANTDIHVTASDKQNWNNKSDFSGSYNDLTDKPTIPVVPTNVSAFNNDAGYVTQTNIDAAVSGKVNTTDFNTYSANTDARLSEDEEVTAAALNSLNSNKQDKLTAGENITINGNVISAAGGNNVIELTQAQYDALTDIDPDAFYIITDADGGVTTGQVQTMINDSISGKADTSAVTEAVSSKMDTSAFNIYSANTNARLSEDEEVTAAGLNALNDALSDKADTSAFTAHTADTVIHVTSTEKATWNAKSDFSGDYNDLTNKPTIPTVPTSNTAFTNDAGYITSSALDGYATTGDVQTATSDMATKTWVGNQGYLTEHQSLSNYYTKSETSGATEISTALASKADTSAVTASISAAVSGKADASAFTAHTADTTIHTTSAEKTVWNGAATNASNAITALGGLKLVSLTQAEYDNLATKDASTVYFIVNNT